jgi:hypothetical protein
MEKRRSHRLYTDLPIALCVSFRHCPGRFDGRATMKNISRGGAYLEIVGQPGFQPGQIGRFTFRALSPWSSPGQTIQLVAKAVVRRIDSTAAFSLGLAVEFLSGPLIAYQ